MIFFFSKLVGFVVRPSTIAVILCCAGLPLLWTRRRAGLGRALLLAGVTGLVLMAWSPVGNWLLQPLEDRFPHPSVMPERVDGIIVLGGAVETGIAEERGIPALNGSAERMTAFVALARQYPKARLAFTGGTDRASVPEVSEADVARALFSDLGIPPNRVVFEGRSRNTYENAVFSKALLDPKPGEIWLLVTSAWHMPRSVAIFRHAGWPVIAWPVGYKSGQELSTWYDSSVGLRIDMTDRAIREWVGLIAYRLLGRTGELFPAPRPTSLFSSDPVLQKPDG